ncbi:MAG: hypothetical protein M3Y28_01670 [Armatimonadota bacterium]|nr:hypothetical protein [Armatimonadota bacterium]
MPNKSNRYLEAFKEGSNLVGLTTLVAASAALLTPLPLVAGLVAEAAYLLFVPDSKWYASRLSRRNDAEVEQRRQLLKYQTLPLLDSEMQGRFTRLEEIRRQINTQAQQDQKWFLEVLRKLDYLLEKFLLFAAKEAEFRAYLGNVWLDECSERNRQTGARQPLPRVGAGRPSSASSRSAQAPRIPAPPMDRVAQLVKDIQASYAAEVAQVETLRKDEADENTKMVLDKRIEVLQQRTEGVGKIGRILTNLQYQLSLLEDTFGLINDQIRARSPEQVLADIDGVVYQTDSMTKLLDELAPFEQMTA